MNEIEFCLSDKKLKKYFVDCKIEIGCACEIEAHNEEEAIEIAKEEWEDYEVDRAHYNFEANAAEMKK